MRTEIFSYGLADIRQRGSQAQVRAGSTPWRVGEQRNILAAMVGGRRGRIAAVIRGENQQVVAAQLGLKRWQPRVHFFERAGVAFDVVAMPVELVEVHQIYEDQTAIEIVDGGQSLGHAVGIVLRLLVFANAAP